MTATHGPPDVLMGGIAPRDKVGCEISFNRHFYTCMAPPAGGDAELEQAEAGVVWLSREVAG